MKKSGGKPAITALMVPTDLVLAGLHGEIPPDYKFSDDKFWNICDSGAEE